MSLRITVMAASHTHVSRYACTAASACLNSARLVPHPPDLINWVQREGGYVHPSIEIASLKGEETARRGLGLVASDEIPKGTDLITLPRHIPLRFEAEDHESSVLSGLARHVPKELWAMKLGLKLLQERARKGSVWWPYISNLTKTYTLPIFFPDEDIKELEYPPLLHQEISKVQIKQGHSIELNYGCLNNDLFLLYYGFVVPSNPYDYVELEYNASLLDAASMALGNSHPYFSKPSSWKKQILSRLNLDGENSNLKVRIGGLEIVEDRLLAAVRVLLCKDKEAVEMQDLDTLKSIKSEAHPLEPQTIATFRTLALLCVMALEHFPADITEDESTVKQEISATTEMAIRYRIQKKEVIIGAMKKLSRKAKLLNAKERISAQ